MVFLVNVLIKFLLVQDQFGVKSLKNSPEKAMAALYLQVSIVSQALIFVIRTQKWSYVDQPGILLMTGFVISQLVKLLHLYYFKTEFHYSIIEGFYIMCVFISLTSNVDEWNQRYSHCIFRLQH